MSYNFDELYRRYQADSKSVTLTQLVLSAEREGRHNSELQHRIADYIFSKIFLYNQILGNLWTHWTNLSLRKRVVFEDREWPDESNSGTLDIYFLKDYPLRGEKLIVQNPEGQEKSTLLLEVFNNDIRKNL